MSATNVRASTLVFGAIGFAALFLSAFTYGYGYLAVCVPNSLHEHDGSTSSTFFACLLDLFKECYAHPVVSAVAVERHCLAALLTVFIHYFSARYALRSASVLVYALYLVGVAPAASLAFVAIDHARVRQRKNLRENLPQRFGLVTSWLFVIASVILGCLMAYVSTENAFWVSIFASGLIMAPLTYLTVYSTSPLRPQDLKVEVKRSDALFFFVGWVTFLPVVFARLAAVQAYLASEADAGFLAWVIGQITHSDATIAVTLDQAFGVLSLVAFIVADGRTAPSEKLFYIPIVAVLSPSGFAAYLLHRQAARPTSEETKEK